MPTLVPVDAVALAIAHLKAHHASDAEVRVSGRVLTRSKMVKVESGGGSRSTHVIDRHIIIIQTWDEDSELASELCRSSFAAMFNLVDTGQARDVVAVGLPVEFPDPATNTPRYQASVEINARPQEAA